MATNTAVAADGRAYSKGAASPPSPSPATKMDNAIRQYLASIHMAPILEEFVAETVAERPDDVYAFMEAFAKRKRFEQASSNEWTFLRSWEHHAAKNDEALSAFASSFFNLLFITQRTMRHTVFSTVVEDLTAKGLALAKVMDRMVRGQISDIELAALAASHTADLPIEPYHFQAIVSTLLLAVRQSMPEAAWDATADEWRSFCMGSAARVEKAVTDAKTAARITKTKREEEEAERARALAVEKTNSAAGSRKASVGNSSDNARQKVGGGASSPEDATETTTKPTLTAKELWDKMPDAHQQGIVRGALDVLFTQHAPMRRNFFADVDIEALIVKLHPLLEQVVNDTLSDESIVATGVVEKAVALGAQPYHVQYCVTALLMSVSMALGRAQWEDGEVAEVWRDKVFSVGERVTALVESGAQKRAKEEEEARKELEAERAEAVAAGKGEDSSSAHQINEEEL